MYFFNCPVAPGVFYIRYMLLSRKGAKAQFGFFVFFSLSEGLLSERLKAIACNFISKKTAGSPVAGNSTTQPA